MHVDRLFLNNLLRDCPVCLGSELSLVSSTTMNLSIPLPSSTHSVFLEILGSCREAFGAVAVTVVHAGGPPRLQAALCGFVFLHKPSK